MAKISTRKMVLCALFSALITVATMVIQIPSPMNGYVNLGDVFVLFAAFALGPVYGTIAAGLGSALADIITGYVIYAPGTMIIKGVMAVVAYFIFISLKKTVKHYIPAAIVAGVVAELIMVLGYFLYACLLMGEGLAAAASIPGNLIQGAVGVVVSTLLVIVFEKRGLFDKFND